MCSEKIILLASGEIGCNAGIALLNSKYNLISAVTPPAKPKGRGQSLSLCPAGAWASKNNIECIETKSLRKDEIVKQKIADLNPDLIVCADFGQIIPDDIIALPKIACINVHPSLLPKYRGAAPINWPIINGDKKTGVSIMFVAHDLDAGDVIIQEEENILEDDTSITLELRLAKKGGDLLIKAIDELINKTAKPIKQDESKVTWAPKLEKENGLIDWTMTADEILNRIKGLKPWPGTFTYRNGKRIKILNARLAQGKGACGELISSLNSLVITTREDAIEILELQLEGKKPMDSASFINGYKPTQCEIWGE